ncbi:MAG: flagellin [Phycisphaerae bacterium]
MAVTPVNVARVSQNLRAFNLLNTVRGTQLGLFRTQNQLATGLRFQAPSEDPLRASAAERLDRHMDVLGQVDSNLRTAKAVLSEGDQAMSQALDLMNEAHGIASQAAGDILSDDERRSLAQVISGIVDQTIAVGNRRYLNSYLFSGHKGSAPFALEADGVVYRGDTGRRETIIDTDLSQDQFTLSGAEYFGAVSTGVHGVVDLDPTLTAATRVADLRGANGLGVTLGRISVSDGSQTAAIDLSGAATVGDILDALNAGLPPTLQAVLSSNAINIMPQSGGVPAITVDDLAGSTTAADLGILQQTPIVAVLGLDVDAVVTPRTPISALNKGLGLALAAPITIRNGARAISVDLSTATTVEDVLNRINGSGADVWARIADDGKTIEVLNRVSGADLRIEENGGQTATALGIRSLHAGSLLSSLNDGLGIDSVSGADIRITTASGATIDIDVDSINLASATMQDVLNLFNNAGGGAITASLASSGNGIVITDNTIGPGSISAQRLNVSPALDSLGLDVSGTGNRLVGRDINPVRVDSPFTALLELRNGLEAADQRAITAAGERLQRATENMQAVHGRMASMAKSADDRADRVDAETSATRVMISDVRDVDLAEAVVQFQQMQTALQANLSTASRVLGLSLLDYLR